MKARLSGWDNLTLSAHIRQCVPAIGANRCGDCGGTCPRVNEPGFLDAVANGGFDDDVQRKHCDQKSQDASGDVPKHKARHLKLNGPKVHNSSPLKVTNLDASDLRLVKKRQTVRHAQWPTLVGTVKRVSRGFCLVHWAGSVEHSTHWFRCSSVEVVDLGKSL